MNIIAIQFLFQLRNFRLVDEALLGINISLKMRNTFMVRHIPQLGKYHSKKNEMLQTKFRIFFLRGVKFYFSYLHKAHFHIPFLCGNKFHQCNVVFRCRTAICTLEINYKLE